MKRKTRMLLAAVVVILLAPVLITAVLVEDWSRDLTTNTAATDAGAADPRLRPLTVEATSQAVVDAVRDFAEQRPGWIVVEASDQSIQLVRTTRLLRFKDDVEVVLTEESGRLRVDVSSASRVGRGDLGQNPRNIREMLDALRARLEGDGQP